MDIAEIRKKAKFQTKPDNPDPDSANEMDSGRTHEPSEVQGQREATEVVTPQQPLAVFEESVVADQEASDGLERLFSASEDFTFATEGAYADILEQQSDAQSRTRQQYLSFHLSDEEYALDITQINEIIKVREFTDVPRVPEHILGIISLRGVVVPVFDLRQRLNLGKSELMLSSRIIVCLLDDITVGLLVDSINQVVNLVDEEVEPPPGVLSGMDRDMVTGIGRYQGRMIILLNLHRVLDVELD